jgi:Leucine-rich repeat (LRR) protein
MEFISNAFKKIAEKQYSLVPNDDARIEHEDPKQRFGHSLAITRHDRSDDFNAAIDHFYTMDIAEIEESDLRPLVHGCMVHGATAALREILPLYEGVDDKTLRIEGPMDERGWKTLVEAVEKDPLLVEALALWNLQLDCSKGELLFKALAHMPELHRLHLGRVGAESIPLFSEFSRLECPPLKVQTMMVSAGSTDIDVFPLLLKVLGSCKLLNLSLVDEGGATMAQHEMLGKALQEQVELQSLRLGCHAPKNFMACYMPFLEMETPLKELDLNHCDVGTHLANKLLEVLPRSKPCLWSLALTSCNLRRCEGTDGRLQISHLAGLPRLVELDLSHNPLEDDTLVPLLYTFAREKKIRLQRLNLNGTLMRDETAKALGDLLVENRTLISVGFVNNGRRDDLFLRPLVSALQHNTSLLQLEVSGFAHGGWRNAMHKHLDRNRKAFNKAVADGMEHDINLLLNGMSLRPNGMSLRPQHSSYRDIANRIIDLAEFSDSDALALSLLDKSTWAERHKAPQADDAPT